MTQLNKKVLLITGVAGFIGYHLAKKMIELNQIVVGIDNINDYYDTNLKFSRLSNLGIDIKKAKVYNYKCVGKDKFSQFTFFNMDLTDKVNLNKLFKDFNFFCICNLAAQAGVRYSIINPNIYIESNITGFLNILELSRKYNVKKIVYASSSSVYGNNKKIPFSENHNVDSPISVYAASKKSNELFASTYSNLYSIEMIGLRFFTVYGPWGRPDMALFLFTKAIIEGKEINVFNNGDLYRDFTYIDDIIEGVQFCILKKSKNKSLNKLYNIGYGSPIKLTDFIDIIEDKLNIKSKQNILKMQPGDVYRTFADTRLFQKDYGYNPKTNLKLGVSNFIDWYKNYYSK